MMVNPSDDDVEVPFPDWMVEVKEETLLGTVRIFERKLLLKAHSAAVISHAER